MISILKQYLANILISIDQFANVVFFFGDPDETISSNAAKRLQAKEHAGWFWEILGWFLETFDSGHLRRAKEDDEGKDAILK